MPVQPTFLSLPSSVRERIYVFADLVRFCPISLGGDEGSRAASREQRMEHWDHRYKSSLKPQLLERSKDVYCDYRLGKYINKALPECCCPPLPLQLFSVCRAIYQEVTQILYSQNKFVIRLDSCCELYLDPQTIAKMTSLSIRIAVEYYYPKHFCDTTHTFHLTERERQANCASLGCMTGGPALMASSEEGKETLDDWTWICSVLEDSLQPEMRLSVICDCADLETMKQVIQPMEAFPKISKCAIRLAQRPFMAPRQLAEIMAITCIGRTQSQTFRFTDLPKELQRHVLCCTDLVSPYVVEYHPKSHYDPRSRDKFVPFEQESPSCCLRCSDALEACCCPLNSGAFSTTQCNCWSFPKALFGVSKHLRDEATIVFFSQNRFAIREAPPPSNGSLGLCEGLSFFCNLPKLALQSLRWIRFTFAGRTTLGLEEASLRLDGWKAMARFIEQNFSTSTLTVELDFKHGPRYFDMTELLFDLDESSREKLWAAYQNLAEVFFFNDGLEDFFVHLASPDLGPSKVDPELRPNRERILEKRIMGEEYDAQARGKFTKRGIGLSSVPHQTLCLPINC